MYTAPYPRAGGGGHGRVYRTDKRLGNELASPRTGTSPRTSPFAKTKTKEPVSSQPLSTCSSEPPRSISLRGGSAGALVSPKPMSVATSATYYTSNKFPRRPHACRQAGRGQLENKTTPETATKAQSRDAARRAEKTGEKAGVSCRMYQATAKSRVNPPRGTRPRAYFTPEHWPLCHLGLYLFEFEFSYLSRGCALTAFAAPSRGPLIFPLNPHASPCGTGKWSTITLTRSNTLAGKHEVRGTCALRYSPSLLAKLTVGCKLADPLVDSVGGQKFHGGSVCQRPATILSAGAALRHAIESP
jgi:hypothetical protein